MISTLTFIDSLSEKGTPDGMICLRQVAIDIANELFPEPTFKKCRTAEETAIAIAAAKFSRREAEQAHLTELRSWVAQGRIEGKSGKINARVTEDPFIYITKSDRDLYLQSVGLKSKVQSELTSSKSHCAANIEMNFPSMSTKPLIHADTFLEKWAAQCHQSKDKELRDLYEAFTLEGGYEAVERAISNGLLSPVSADGAESPNIPNRPRFGFFGEVFFEREEWSNFAQKKLSLRIDEASVAECNVTYRDELIDSNKQTSSDATENQARAATHEYKKAGLIKELSGVWKSIKSDLNQASKNGLALAAKVNKRGWDRNRAIDWAKSKGKYENVQTSKNTMANAPSSVFEMGKISSVCREKVEETSRKSRN